MHRAAMGIAWLALATNAHAESPCGRAIRDAFDQAGRAAAGPLNEASIDKLEEQLRARPDRCAPGDYALFISRYADLLTVISAGGVTDPERRLAAEVRVLAPRRVAQTGYESAFRAFLDARARLASHLPTQDAPELLALFDEVRPQEILPSVSLGKDRDGVIQGLSEIRERLALGQVAAADAQAEALLHALQNEPTPDAGAPDAGPADAGR
ncbi:MAG: hypothetical protein JST54_30850 [Deltaproteobacteria bacterium]|nr:hypothetical protein [Deltaproteobacteria bacterium]